MKECYKCHALWNEWAFKDGGNICPDCIRAYNRRWRKASPERYQYNLDRNVAYYHAHSSSALAHSTDRRQCAVCGIVKGKRSFADGKDRCRRCAKGLNHELQN